MQPPHGQRHQNPAPVVQRLNPQEQQAYKELLGRLEGHGNLNDLHSPFVQKHNPEQLLFQRERIHVSASEIPQPNKLYHPLQLFDLSHDGNFARAGIPHRRHLPYGIPKPKQADNPYEHAQIQNRLIQRRNPQKRYHNPNAQQGDGDVTLSDYEKLSNDQKQLVDLTEEAHQHNSCMLGKGSFGSVFAIHASSLAAEKGGGEVTAVKRQECNRGKTHLARAELRMVRTLSGIPGASRFICQALNTAAVRREQDIFYMEMPLASCTLEDILNKWSKQPNLDGHHKLTCIVDAFFFILAGFEAFFWLHHIVEKTLKHALVHCDVKPANFLYHNHTLVLADFGLAERIGAPISKQGTEGYWAPEVRKCSPGSHWSPAQDYYSFGKVIRDIEKAIAHLWDDNFRDMLNEPAKRLSTVFECLSHSTLQTDPSKRQALTNWHVQKVLCPQRGWMTEVSQYLFDIHHSKAPPAIQRHQHVSPPIIPVGHAVAAAA